MARSITSRPVNYLPLPKDNTLVPEPITFFRPAKGMNTAGRITTMPREYGTEITNLVLHRGYMKTRLHIGLVGGSAPDPIMLAFEFRTADGTSIVLRFTTRDMQYFDGASWITIPDAGFPGPGVPPPLFTGGITNFFSVTAFGKKLIFTNGIDGLFSFNPATMAITKITTSSSVPNAQHLTTFAGRVVATNYTDGTGNHPTGVSWSSKNDETKWDGAVDLGAGFEEVTSSPNPDTDICQATIPITDELALICRRRSIWLMSATGIADVPFRFSLLHDQVGTESPYSIVAVLGGLVGFFDDDFYFVDRNQAKPVGTPIVDDLNEIILAPRELWGTFDPFRKEYRCVIKEDSAIWRYSMRDATGWSRDVYPFTPKTIAAIGHYTVGGLMIDGLTGTIDGLVGTIDELGGGTVVRGGAYITPNNAGLGGFVTREDPTRTTDVNGAGADTASQFVAATAAAVNDSPLYSAEVVELQLEYESPVTQTVYFQYSLDGGASWSTMDAPSASATTVPSILSARKSLTGSVSASRLMFRITTFSGFNTLLVHALHVFATKGAKLAP